MDKILRYFSMENFKKGDFSTHRIVKLGKTQSPSTEEEIVNISQVPYALGVGSIMYVMTCTPPDVSPALIMVSRFHSNPRRAQ